MRLIPMLAACMLSSPAFAADDAAPSPPPASAPTTADQISPRSATCVEVTGSRIKPRPGECLPTARRVHNAEDLESTGATSVGDALRQLDPALR
jgi:hypothetical protein